MQIPIDRPLIDGRNTREAATQTVGLNFVATHNQRHVLILTCAGVDRVSAAPHIQEGVRVGQLLTILVTDDANRITITDDGAGTILNGDWVVGDGYGIGAKIWLVWDGTRWWEIDRKNGELDASGLVAHAEGFSTTASGSYSHAEGRDTTANGNSGSHAEGYLTTASGSSSHAEGNSTTASNDRAHAEGYLTAASGPSSHAGGIRSESALSAEFAIAGGRFAATGDAQRSVVVARIATTNAVLTETFLDGTDDLLTILDEYTYACKVTVVGRQDTGADSFMGTYHVLIQRTGGGAPVLVGAVDRYENNPGGWGAGGGLPVSILAGATNLEVWVEGLAGHNIRWVAVVEMVRVGFAD